MYNKIYFKNLYIDYLLSVPDNKYCGIAFFEIKTGVVLEDVEFTNNLSIN